MGLALEGALLTLPRPMGQARKPHPDPRGKTKIRPPNAHGTPTKKRPMGLALEGDLLTLPRPLGQAQKPHLDSGPENLTPAVCRHSRNPDVASRRSGHASPGVV